MEITLNHGNLKLNSSFVSMYFKMDVVEYLVYRNLLNSYRSLCAKVGSSEFAKVLTKDEELMQGLIQQDPLPHQTMNDAMLQVVSEWLGKEFNTMTSQVQENVKAFKTKHIESIDKLPSPVITCSYFPRPMVTLFECWLSSASVATLEPSASGCCSAPPDSKRSRSAQFDIYPFVQLLLEFSNNALISGVAHVVYTQLLKDPT